jgi:hypothetical protein
MLSRHPVGLLKQALTPEQRKQHEDRERDAQEPQQGASAERHIETPSKQFG